MLILLSASTVVSTVRFFFDDVVWEPKPLCPDVTQITAYYTAATQAGISWAAGNDETEWDIVYGSTDVTDPNTLVPVSPAPTSISAEITELTPNSSYKVWVRSVCGINNGDWIGPIIFKTKCLPVDVVNENFNAIEYMGMPDCWSVVKNGSGISAEAYANVTDYNFHSAASALVMNNYNSTTAGNFANLILVSPQLNSISGGTYVVNFFVKGSTPAGSIQVGTVPNDTDDAIFNEFQTIDITTEYVEHTIHIPIADDHYVAFRHNSQTQFNAIYIDDVTIDTTLGNENFEANTFNIYPNPVKDILHISNDQNINNIKVFNLLGQQVVTKEVYARNVQIDLSDLVYGTYLVKITSENQTKTIKMIKQ